ncbi:MAG TPA: 50S ribosomal protein L25 [Bacteroidales bacterium]|nr:50S ribosomal protein L25 [Bacteroidales bacterium]HPI85124.1 50S ribosomal protein L25 [Bacteroidales bacterium]HPM93194.1 50S ribosomal protein L25 [Bacteroidales bacterium]
MKTVSMSGSLRESVGKKDAKLQRSEGRIPCVLYGGKDQIKFVADEKSFHEIIFSPESYFIKMTVDGKTYDCVLKDIQYHPVSDTILHADFIEFSMDHPLTMSVPVRLTGNAPGVIKGGQLVKKFRKLNVRALPADMPEAVTIDIGNLDIEQKITIREIAQEKFKILENPDRYIVAIRATRASATPDGKGEAPAK